MKTSNLLSATLLASLALAAPAARQAFANPDEPTIATVERDATLEKLLDLVKGHFANDERAIAFYEIQSQDAGRMLVGEFFTLENPSQPEGQVVFQFIRRADGVYLRTSRFPAGSRTAPGLWAAPAAVPVIQASGLDILADLKVTMDSESEPTSFEASTMQRVPVYLDRAVEMETTISASSNGVVIHEVGYDPTGAEAFRFPEGGVGQYQRVAPPTVEVRNNGLIVVDLIPSTMPEARVSEPGDKFTVNYTGWLPNGLLFDTSKQEGRTPLSMDIPAQNLIAGWNQGLPGMKVGSVRRLIIPSELGYGARGQPQAGIGPNSWLIFDLELIDAQAKPAPTTEPAGPQPE